MHRKIKGVALDILNSSSYSECVLKAVNLGGDMDTVKFSKNGKGCRFFIESVLLDSKNITMVICKGI